MNSNDTMMAITLNNQAATLIEAGDYLSAIANLAESLMFVKKTVAPVPMNGKDESATHISLDQILNQNQSLGDTRTESDQQYNHPLIVRHSLHIPTSLMSAITTSRDHVIVSVVVLFNLSLAYNLRAFEVQDSSPREMMLRKAAKLYELSFNLYRDLSCAETSMMFTLVIYNNLGHLHRHMGDTEMANKYFQSLLSMLMYIVDGPQRRDAAQNLEQFFGSVSLCILQDTFFAAAA